MAVRALLHGHISAKVSLYKVARTQTCDFYILVIFAQ